MKKTLEATARGVPWSRLETGLFLLLFYLYVWLVIDPRLLHHSLGIMTPYRPFSFHTGWPFFAQHATSGADPEMDSSHPYLQTAP